MNQSELVYVTLIRTTPEKLWAAITQPEFTRQYWGGGENVSEWSKGAPWRHVGPGEPRTVRLVGEVLESLPPRRLVLSWAEPDETHQRSTVTFDIQPAEDLVILKVIHSDLGAGSPMAEKVAWGWPRVLSSMKSFLETGQGLNVYAMPEGTQEEARACGQD